MKQEKIERIIIDALKVEVGLGSEGVPALQVRGDWVTGCKVAAAEIAKLVEEQFEASAELGSKITDTEYQRLLEYRYQNEKSRVKELEAQLADKDMTIGVLKATIEEWKEIEDRLRARLKMSKNGLRACGDEYDTLLAQVAEMREALEMADKFARSIEFVNRELVETWPIREAIKQALAAAPEVLWAGEVAWQDDMHGLGRPGITFPPLKERLAVLLSHQPLRDSDGHQVKVIVVAGKEMKDELD